MANRLTFSDWLKNDSEQEQFNEWKEDGNVIKMDNGYATQDAQYTNRLKNIYELKKYYFNEFIKGQQFDYADGGSLDDINLVAKAIEYVTGSAIDKDSIQFEADEIAFKYKSSNKTWTTISQKLIKDTISMHRKSLELRGRYAEGGEVKVDGLTKQDFIDAYLKRVDSVIENLKQKGQYDSEDFDLLGEVDKEGGFTKIEDVGYWLNWADIKRDYDALIEFISVYDFSDLSHYTLTTLAHLFFGKPMKIEFFVSSGGDSEYAYNDELQKIKLLLNKIDFNKVVGSIDYDKTKNNTDLDFYKDVELVMSLNGDWNETTEELDTTIDFNDETAELNYHPLDTMGGLDLTQLEENINEAFRELNTYSAVVSIEGYEEYAEDVEGLENARATIQDIKGNTRFQVLKGSSVGIGKRVDDSRVIEEFRKGGNVSSIEKKVQEVNRLIELGNKNDISVVDSRSTWEAPMKYKPIRYSNGVLYIEYQQLDLYKYNKKGISNWVTKKDKVLKRDMQFDNPLNDIAKMYRKALKQEGVEFAKGGEAGELKDYVVYSWKTKKDVINDDYEIINEEEMTEKDVIELYKERIKRGYDLAIRIIEKSSRNEVYTSKSYDDIIDAHYSDSEDEGNDYYDLKEKILSKYGLHLEGNRVRTNFKSTAHEIANEFDGYVEQDSDYYIVSFRNLYAKGGETKNPKKYVVTGNVYDGGQIWKETFDNIDEAIDLAREIQNGWTDDGTYYLITIYDEKGKKVATISDDKYFNELTEHKFFKKVLLGADTKKERQVENEKLKGYKFNLQVRIADGGATGIFDKTFDSIFDVMDKMNTYYEEDYYAQINDESLGYWEEKYSEIDLSRNYIKGKYGWSFVKENNYWIAKDDYDNNHIVRIVNGKPTSDSSITKGALKQIIELEAQKKYSEKPKHNKSLSDMKKIWDKLSDNYMERENIAFLIGYSGGNLSVIVPKKFEQLDKSKQISMMNAYFGQTDEAKEKIINQTRKEHEALVKKHKTLRNLYGKKYADGGGVKNPKQIFAEYEENEGYNRHSENVVLLAENFGSEQDVKDAKEIVEEHIATGYLTDELRKRRNKLDSKLYPKLIEALDNKYADGGEAGFDDAGTSMGMYHEKKGNFIVPKGQIYLWLYDNEDGASKMNSGEYDFVMYPYASMSMAWQKGFIPPLKRIWTKKFQKDHKGSEHLLGVVKAYLIEEKGKKELFIDMMSVNPNSKKKGIMSYMIKDLRDTFNLSKDQVKFSQLTKEGEKFVNKGKYADGGNTEILTKPRPVTEPAPTQTPAPSKPDRNNPYKPKVTPKPKMSKYDYIWLVK